MMLKSFGCSFIYGTDLSDDGRANPYASPSKLTWPSLLAQHLGHEYQCRAYPGSGNLRIMESIISEAALDQDSFYVIGWTWIDRFDHTNGQIKPWNKLGWGTVMPIDTDHVAEIYYKNLHSQFRDKLTNLVYIDLVIRVLNEKNIKFIMTYMDNLLFETQWHTSPGIIEIQDRIKPYLKNFQGQNFVDWSRDRGFEISPTLHPLEPAHRAAADLVIENIDDYLCHSA